MRWVGELWSGGQTGVDIGALRAASALGIRTGGYMPRGWLTLDGPRPCYREMYGLMEHVSPLYPPRTHKNVQCTDLTIRIAADLGSAGERCTERAIREHGKPFADIRLAMADGRYHAPRLDIGSAVGLIRGEASRMARPLRVNVAGNSERTTPGIEAAAERLVRYPLEMVEEQ